MKKSRIRFKFAHSFMVHWMQWELGIGCFAMFYDGCWNNYINLVFFSISWITPVMIGDNIY